MMTGDDVATIVERLDGARIDAWLDGGWAVDALLGEQTRVHDDLDLIVRVTDVPAMRAASKDVTRAPPRPRAYRSVRHT